MKAVKIKLKEGAIAPRYETAGSAGMDIRALLNDTITLLPGERMLIPTGIYLELDEGYEAQIRARSGLAIKYGIGMINGIGTIDSDYRGEIMIPLINWGNTNFKINNHDRIAQLIICKYEKVKLIIVDNISTTNRNNGGFGHTGLK